MAGSFIGKVLATASGIAVYEIVVRPRVASRLMGTSAEPSEAAELERELDESDARLAEAERELAAQDRALLED
ncbi:MAG: hypothetical protein V3T07_05225 [Myxococcota bacterium]